METNCTCNALRRAARKISSIYDDELKPLGISVAQFSLLRRIDWAGPLSLTELGRLIELDRSTVGRNVKVLERMGLVETVPAEDGREASLALGEKGWRVLKAAVPLWKRAQRKVDTKLGEDGAAQLRQLLQAL